MHLYYKHTLFLTLILCNPVLSQSLLPPPFGLKWGEAPKQLLQWADENSLEIRITSPIHERSAEYIRIERKHARLPNHQAKALEARFNGGLLYEISLIYEDFGSTPASTIKEAFLAIKADFEQQIGKMKKNRDEQSSADNFNKTSIGYFAEPAPGLIFFMAYTELSDLLRKKTSSRFTLIYHNDNFSPKAERVRAPRKPRSTPSDNPSP